MTTKPKGDWNRIDVSIEKDRQGYMLMTIRKDNALHRVQHEKLARYRLEYSEQGLLDQITQLTGIEILEPEEIHEY